MDFKKSALVLAMTASLGLSAVTTVNAAVITASWEGLFTILNSAGVAAINFSAPYGYDPTWGYGKRTQISGTFNFDTSTGAGSATVNPFGFFGFDSLYIQDFTLQAIGDGVGGQGTLVAGGMLWDFGGNNNITIGIVFDAAGFFGALPAGTSTTISGVGALPASDAMASLLTIPVGPAPMATTTWNTDYNVNPGCVLTASCLTSNDTIGGDPMDNGPFPGFSANFDITSIDIYCSVCQPEVPVPAAAWLFGSGLLGLVGVARRKQSRSDIRLTGGNSF